MPAARGRWATPAPARPAALILLATLAALLLAAPASADDMLAAGVAMSDGTDPWASYTRTDALLTELHRMAAVAPGRVRFESIPPPPDPAAPPPPPGTGTRVEPPLLTWRFHRYDLDAPPAGSAPAHPPAPPPPPPLRAVFTFGEHPREMITTEVALWLARVLAGRRAAGAVAESPDTWPESRHASALSAPALGRDSADRTLASRAEELLSRLEVVLVPVVALHGRRRVETGETCLRKGTGGVDLNRNYALHWAPPGLESEASDEHPGPRPFSEPETRAVAALITTTQPSLFVAVHAGEFAVYSPWDHTASPAPVAENADAGGKKERAVGVLPPDLPLLLSTANLQV